MTRILCTGIATALAATLATPAAAQDWNAIANSCANDSGETAVAACTQVIESGRWQNAGLAWAYNNRGNAYNGLGQYDRAIEDLDRAIALKLDYPKAFNNRGATYNALGQYARAIEDLDRAIALKPDYPEAFNNRGNAYNALGQYAHAIEDYDQAIVLRPNYAMALNNRCYARAIWEQQFDQAEADCDKALELMPGEPNILDSKGFLYLRMARYSTAIPTYSAALAKAPKLASSLYGRGLARLKLHQIAAGRADMAAAKAIDPKIAETFAKGGIVWREP